MLYQTRPGDLWPQSGLGRARAGRGLGWAREQLDSAETQRAATRRSRAAIDHAASHGGHHHSCRTAAQRSDCTAPTASLARRAARQACVLFARRSDRLARTHRYNPRSAPRPQAAAWCWVGIMASLDASRAAPRPKGKPRRGALIGRPGTTTCSFYFLARVCSCAYA